MPPTGLEAAIPTSERPQTYALDRASNASSPVHNLEKGSALRRDLYQHNTENTQETDIDVPDRARTRNPYKRAAADVRLRPHVQCVQSSPVQSSPVQWNNIQNPEKSKALALAAL